MLKFSANISMLFTEVAMSERFQAAKQQGFQAVEMQFPYSLSAESIAEALHEHDLQLVLFNVAADDLLQGGAGLACVPEKQAQFQEAVAQALAYAKLLRPQAINVLPGRCVQANRYDEYMQTFKDNLLFAEQAFTAVGVKTVFEAINTLDMPGFMVSTGSQMLDILEQLNVANLSMQFDIYHSQMMAIDPVAFIRRHADKIGHIQFADCPGRGQPGTGQIDFQRLFSEIDSSAYTGWLGAEYKPIGSTSSSLAWFGDMNIAIDKHVSAKF
ncbi:MAG: TIM barrel protein [Methylococcales bacterium]